MPIPQCSCCGSAKAVRTCGRCRLVAYCSTACQAQHWDTHKPECTGCPICHEDLGAPSTVATTICGHMFHKHCLLQLVKRTTLPLMADLTCPLCRSPLLCWLGTDVPCGFDHRLVLRLFIGILGEAIEQYQLVLLIDPRAPMWLKRLDAHPALAAMTSLPTFVQRDICSTKSQIICYPTPTLPWAPEHFFLVCLLAPAQLRNICALRSASQDTDVKHVVKAQRRYWLVLASPAGNKLAELVRVGASVGALRAGAPPELPELPPERTAHWAYESRKEVPWEAHVCWEDPGLLSHPTEDDKARLNAQFLAYSPELSLSKGQ